MSATQRTAWSIVPNDNEKVREDSRGHIHVSHARSWVVISDGEFLSEHRLLRDARAALAAQERTK